MKKRILIAAITSLGLVGMAQADNSKKPNLFKVEKTSGEIIRELKEKGTFSDSSGQVYQSWELKEVAEAAKKTTSSTQKSMEKGGKWKKGQSKNLIKEAAKRGKSKDKNHKYASLAGNIGQLTGTGLGSSAASIDYDNASVQPVAGTGVLAGLSFNNAAFAGTKDLKSVEESINSKIDYSNSSQAEIVQSEEISKEATMMGKIMEGMEKYEDLKSNEIDRINQAKATMTANAIETGNTNFAQELSTMSAQKFFELLNKPEELNILAGAANLNQYQDGDDSVNQNQEKIYKSGVSSSTF